MKKLIVISVFILFSNTNYGAEVDSFTGRYTKIKDSLHAINKKSNQFFQKSLALANESRQSCDEKALYRSFRKHFRNHVFGKLTPWMDKTEKVEKIRVGLLESIYQDFLWYQAPSLGGLGRIRDTPIASLIKVNGHLVGIDKFEHFSGSGYRYFKKHYLKGRPLDAALSIGRRAENGLLGNYSTGVKAYADLVANFNGMRFWNHLLQKNNDVLGKKYNIGPYVKCKKERWIQVKKMDWSFYIDDAFDEGINCSQFRTKKMLIGILDRISVIKDKNAKRRFSCPISRSRLKRMVKKYGHLSKELINTRGHGQTTK